MVPFRLSSFKALLLCLGLMMLVTISSKAQDASAPFDSTTIFSRYIGVLKRGTVLKTSNNHFYEINDKIEQKVRLDQSIIKVYKEGKKFKISIAGIDRLLFCRKLEDVIESNIDGDFSGWDGNTIFNLTNTQRWQQDSPTGTIFVNLFKPAVMIYSTPEGFKMKIAGVDEDPIIVKKLR
jgi:hypothetical protein